MGIASVFVLSSLLLSPLAMAEESQAFVTRNAELAAVHQESREALAHKADAASPQNRQPRRFPATPMSIADRAPSHRPSSLGYTWAPAVPIC
jgi:hypothetical protein